MRALALPRDSALVRAVLGAAAEWSWGEELLASLLEVSDGVALRHLSALGAKRLPTPLKVKRPGDSRPKRRLTVAEMVGGGMPRA